MYCFVWCFCRPLLLMFCDVMFVCAAFKSFTSKCINYIPTHTHTHHITSVIKHKRPKRKEEDELNVYLPSRQTKIHHSTHCRPRKILGYARKRMKGDTYCVRRVNAALVILDGRWSPLIISCHNFLLITSTSPPRAITRLYNS